MIKFTAEPHEYRGHLGQIHRGRYSGILGMGKRLTEWEQDEGLDEEVAQVFNLSTQEGHPQYFEDKALKRQMEKEKKAIERAEKIEEGKEKKMGNKRLTEWEQDEGLDKELEGHLVSAYLDEKSDKELKSQMEKEKRKMETIDWAEFVKDRRIKRKLDEKLKAQEEREERGDLDRKRRMKLVGYGSGYSGIVRGDHLRYGNGGNKGLNFISGMGYRREKKGNEYLNLDPITYPAEQLGGVLAQEQLDADEAWEDHVPADNNPDQQTNAEILQQANEYAQEVYGFDSWLEYLQAQGEADSEFLAELELNPIPQ